MSARRWTLAAIALVLAIAAYLRVEIASHSGLWVDEVFSLAMATGHGLEHPADRADVSQGDFVEGASARPARELRAYLAPPEKRDTGTGGIASVTRAVRTSDTSPPLYYVLLHAWTNVFGASDRALRALSTVLALLCMPMLAWIAFRIGGWSAVLPACVLFAFAPNAIHYSIEGRMYALLWFCTLATAVASVAWRSAERGRWPAIGWIVASIAGLWTHYFFAFVWAVFAVWLALDSRRVRRMHLAAAVVVVLVAVAPWYVHIPSDLRSWRVTAGWLELEPGNWNRWDALWHVPVGFLSGRGVSSGDAHSDVFALALAAMCVAGLVMHLRSRANEHGQVWLWSWLAASVLGLLVFDAWRHTYTLSVPRYALTGLPAAVLIASLAISRLDAWARLSVLALTVALWYPDLKQMSWASRCGEPFREIAQDVSGRASARDVVIVHSIPSGVLGFARYAAPDLRIAAWVEQLGERRACDDLARITAGCDHVFLVRAHEVNAPAPIEDELRRIANVVSDETRETIRVVEFDLRARPAAPQDGDRR